MDLGVGPGGLDLPADRCVAEDLLQVDSLVGSRFGAGGGVVGRIEVGGGERTDVVPVSESRAGWLGGATGQVVGKPAGQRVFLPGRPGVGHRLQGGRVGGGGGREGFWVEVLVGVAEPDLRETADKAVVIALW